MHRSILKNLKLYMTKLKKIWLWVSAGLAAIFSIFIIISKFIAPNVKRRSDFKKKNKELESEKKDISKKIEVVETEKEDIKKNIKLLEDKIADEYHLLSEKERKDAIKTLQEFKEKYKK